MWDWQSQEFDLQKDLLPVPSTSLWAEANHSEVDSWSLFDEQTPIKECTDIDLPFCDIGGLVTLCKYNADIIIKDFDEGKETLQAKRRRMLQFCPDNAENSLIELEEQPITKVEKKPPQAKPTPLKAGRSVIRAKKLKVASVAYPFELIKPCGFRGDTTLRDINRKILAPPSYRIKHKIDEASAPYQEASAISGKPVVHKTKIHTEGGKGSITITRTRG
ncbi:unnamed protein product [Triticum turgidum subsp. durum]|uniref:Protein XRI1 n=1 Tax=Triticum turgidum subsp. durum TaxID=4567 RepID=A0A9R1QUH3_TRITD|nr:unnamed protein product [Triticum turgidum subsp. durum]